MKRRLIVVAVCWFAMSGLAAAADGEVAGGSAIGGSAADKTAIEQVVKDYVTHWNKHDMNAFMDLFTDDAEWVNVVGHVWRGKATIKKVHKAVHETTFKNREIRLVNMTVRFIRPDVAVSIVRWNLDGFEAPDGRRFDKGDNISTLVFSKENGKWLIASGENVTVDPMAAAHDPAKQ